MFIQRSENVRREKQGNRISGGDTAPSVGKFIVTAGARPTWESGWNVLKGQIRKEDQRPHQPGSRGSVTSDPKL